MSLNRSASTRSEPVVSLVYASYSHGMNDERAERLFFELFSELPRQGPGNDASTLQALAMVPGLRAESRILDLGCGTGRHTLLLAQHSPSQDIVALDKHAPYVEELQHNVRVLGLDERITACVGDIRTYPTVGRFDLVWCEGALYALGVDEGLRALRQRIEPGGCLAFTEVCWTQSNPPPGCVEYWQRVYPAIRSLPGLVQAVSDAGYQVLGHFSLPSSAWWVDYYRPLEQRIFSFRRRHEDEADAQAIADQVEAEIKAWRAWRDFYSYGFIVARRPLPPEAPTRFGTWHALSAAERQLWLEHAADRIFTRALRKPPKPDAPVGTVFTVSAEQVVDLSSFCCAIGEAVNGPGGYFGANLGSLEDCLAGGFGASRPSTFRFVHCERARALLGHAALAAWAEARLSAREFLDDHGERWLRQTLAEACAGRGPTLFDNIVEMIERKGHVIAFDSNLERAADDT